GARAAHAAAPEGRSRPRAAAACRDRPAVARLMPPAIEDLARDSRDRMALWASFLQLSEVRTAAEVGVYRGAFAEHVLAQCPAIETYYMIDPWRHLDDWNKPANRDDDV